ncbi:MAG: hypothetical protein RLZZ505_1006 [Verrucomicrobiota bacterium]|jgi:hypothetical protein
MKTILSPVRLTALLACITLSTSCYTTYDSYGNARQSVDPGVALMGVAAAGLVGYALADDNDHHYSNNYYGGGGYYRSGGYGHGGGYRPCY